MSIVPKGDSYISDGFWITGFVETVPGGPQAPPSAPATSRISNSARSHQFGGCYRFQPVFSGQGAVDSKPLAPCFYQAGMMQLLEML